ncbi:CHAP domain-containing protein [Kovacikia minuta CCNUW1]|uniref:CHAP domain-containing protein n=1 Tax=Kovacikia minuta TaxID=2931930 RepID=UPI001CC921C9|nr:CHAP domain-containing protein [Kovacikia minuta]UBF25014.1 CHAP domain-containing protein [Kovacikia minuta CCNUW1]
MEIKMMLSSMLNNLLQINKELSLSSSFQTIRDFVGSSNLNDDYRFSLIGRSSISLSLQDLHANGDLQLIQDRNNNSRIDAGEVIATSTQSGKRREFIHSILDSGTYYIRVYAVSQCQNTTYGLSFKMAETEQPGTDVSDGGKENIVPPVVVPPVVVPPVVVPPVVVPPVVVPPPISGKTGPEDLFALSSSQQQIRLGVNLQATSYQASGNSFVRANNDSTFWCTEYAYGRAIEKGLFSDGQGIGGTIWGNADSWDDHIGLSNVKSQARANSFIIWDSNQAGASSFGHVGFVEEVYSDGSFLISEANWNGLDFNLRLINPGSVAYNQAKFIYL